MKKALLICVMCLTAFSFCTLTSCNKDDEGDYVDLGLPSGTKWKIENEAKPAGAACPLFTYDEAMSKYKGHMPFRDQWEELLKYCNWNWVDANIEWLVTGPNGNHITLPAEGYYKKDGSGPFSTNGSFYWSATTYDEEDAYYMDDGGYVSFCDKGYYLSVRLVKQ